MTNAEKTFVTVAKTADLPVGESLVVELGRRWVLIMNVDGELFAVEDMCSHEEFALSEEGSLDGFTLTCNKHGACFDVRTGAVLCPPAMLSIKTFAVRIVEDSIQVAPL
jgi:nitrite reductase/ring-hydroxylating ferredoxin subunit